MRTLSGKLLYPVLTVTALRSFSGSTCTVRLQVLTLGQLLSAYRR